MFLQQFYSGDADAVSITPEQASRFAKEVAGDFNPIHNPDAKRFCVPGDLLFALVLARYGISQRMSFTFSGMVGRGVTLRLPDSNDRELDIRDDLGKSYLQVERHGDMSRDEALTEELIRTYVSFSGQSFPDILVALMSEHRVMINPDRPLVIYDTMAFELEHLDLAAPRLRLADSTLEVKGKRGQALLSFQIEAGGEIVGSGSKKMLLSGLRDYDHGRVQRMRDDYLSWKAAYRAS